MLVGEEEKPMKRPVQVILIVALVQILLMVTLNAGKVVSASPSIVDRKGLTVQTESSYVISGYPIPLNKKYKFRLTETVFEPGGYLGEHEHAGPGLRIIKSGAITSIHPHKTVIYKAGDHFYEPGNAMHELQNKTDAPVRILNFELLPMNWEGASTIPLRTTGKMLQAAPTSATPAHSEAHP